MTGATRSFLSLGRALSLTTARAFVPAASALLAGTFLFAAIPFGGNGIHPADVVGMMARWPAARATLWAIWLALSSPVCARLVAASWVRTLPVPPERGHAVIWAVALGMIAQLPWMVLFGLGDGPLRGMANGLLALALGLAAVTGAALYATLAASAALVPSNALAAFVVAAALAALTARRAWVAGPREAGAPLRVVRRAPAPVAVALAASVSLLRGHRVVAVRAACLCAGFALLAGLLHENQPADARSELARALGVLAIPSSIVAAWLGIPLAATVGEIDRIVVPMGLSVRVIHAGGALALTGALFVFGAAAAVRLPGPLQAIPGLGLWSAALGLIVFGRIAGAEPARVLVRATVIGASGTAVALLGGLIAIPLAAAVAVFFTVRALA